MTKLKEDPLLRDMVSVFEDRTDAGKRLAEYLVSYRDSHGIVLALPSGGVPVAAEIASALNLPLDLLIVRKLQIPDNPEAGFGSIGPDGEVLLNKELMKHLRLTDEQIRIQIEKSRANIEKRNRIFRKEKPFPSLRNMVAIVVDDGLASGYTMLSAVRFLRKMSLKKLVAAVPTGSKKTVEAIVHEVDELFCLNVRSGPFFAVANAYRNWHDLTDEEVLALIKSQARNPR